jgi:glyoxylase-like metal-dependent hydrolase (beta-lactamase superfamily II)
MAAGAPCTESTIAAWFCHDASARMRTLAYELGENVGATYRCDSADWAHFVDRDERVTTLLEPLRDRFEMCDADTRILPGVDALRAPGHTPGSTVVVVSSRDQRLLLLGDMVHRPRGAARRGVARRTRDALAREPEATGALAGAAHFPGLHLGRLGLAAGRRLWALT